jgi:hypothetical protein
MRMPCCSCLQGPLDNLTDHLSNPLYVSTPAPSVRFIAVGHVFD